jgi:hypothetical protein
VRHGRFSVEPRPLDDTGEAGLHGIPLNLQRAKNLDEPVAAPDLCRRPDHEQFRAFGRTDPLNDESLLADQGFRVQQTGGDPLPITDYCDPKWVSGRMINIKLQRNDDRLTAWVDGTKLGPVTITEPAQKGALAEPQRFKLYGWQRGLYSIKNAVLVDGSE